MELLFLGSALLSEVIGTIVGFGSSTIFLPLALLFLDFKTALVLVAFFHLFGNLGRIGFFRVGLDREIILKFGMPSVLATFMGAQLVGFLDQNLLRGLLGVFLVILAAVFWKEGGFGIVANTRSSVLGGATSGFFAGLIGTGGALRGAFLTSFNLSKEKYIATVAAVAFLVDLTRIPLYLGQGFLEVKFYRYLPILLVLALLGSFIGRKIVDIVPQRQFRRAVLMAILIVGLKFIYDWLVA